LLDPLRAGDQLRLAAQRGLADTVDAGPQHAGRRLERGREPVAVQPAGRGHEPDLELSGAPALANDEVAQVALARAAVVRREAGAPAPRHDPIADGVAPFGGEQAIGDLDDLVPSPGGVKAAHQAPLGVAPERVLELVA